MTDEQIEQALERDLTIDITTVGRKTGAPRRKEIWFHNLAGRLFITGLPGRRDWYANLVANPNFTFHLKESVQADLGLSIPDGREVVGAHGFIMALLATDQGLELGFRLIGRLLLLGNQVNPDIPAALGFGAFKA